MRLRSLVRSVWRRTWIPKKEPQVIPPIVKARLTTLDSLKPLFARAKRENLWFTSRHGKLWFSPSELKSLHNKGRYIWGPDNWTLRDPKDFQR
jgi:hypothetical protein